MKRLIMITLAATIAMGAMAQQPTLQSGIKMYQYKNYQSAQKALTPLSVKDPIANYYLGLSYLDAGNTSKAKYQFEKYPEDPANISGTARVAFAMKDAAKGNEIAKSLASKAKKKEVAPLIYAADAITYSEGTDLQQAIQWYKDALVKDANNIDAHLGMADAYRKITGGGGEAMTNYEFITGKEPNNSLVLSRIGDLWYEARNYSDALSYYSKAKDADNTNPLPFKSLSLAYQRTGKYDQALANIRQYLTLSDNTVADQISFVEILYLAKANCEAAKKAQELMNQDIPADRKTSLYGLLGFAQADCGDSVEALRNLRTYFTTQKPKSITPGAYVEYGKLWLKLSNIDSAIFYYTKGIEGDTSKNKSDIYRQIAEALRLKKEFCRAAEWYSRLVNNDTNTQAIDYLWGTVSYLYCKDYKSALNLGQRFERKYREQPAASYWYARALAAVDSEATQGTAAPYFTAYITKLDTIVNRPDKRADVTKSYQYLLLYYFNTKDKEKTDLYMDKLRAFNPNDVLVKQIEEITKGGATPPKKTTTDTKTPPKKK